MGEPADEKEKALLSPWAHPKARVWFQDLLNRSGFLHDLEDEIRTPYEDVELGRARMLMTFLTLLGRPGIWPKNRKKLLQTAVSKINRKTKEAPTVSTKKALTMDEHRKKTKLVSTIQTEIETLRRFAGMSNRKNKLDVPDSWGSFWS